MMINKKTKKRGARKVNNNNRDERKSGRSAKCSPLTTPSLAKVAKKKTWLTKHAKRSIGFSGNELCETGNGARSWHRRDS